MPWDDEPTQGDVSGAVLGAHDLPYLRDQPPRVEGWIEALHDVWGETWRPTLSLGTRTQLAEARRIQLDGEQLDASPSWASAATCFPAEARAIRSILTGFCLRDRRFGLYKTFAMNVRSGVFFGVLAGALAAGETVASEAFALDCSTLPNPVYIQNGDTQEPLLKALGQKLRNAKANPVTLIYKNAGSCTNIDAMYKGTKLTTNPSYIPSQTEDPTWDSTKPSPQCTMSPNGRALDLALSALFVSSCDPSKPPANIGLFQGPVQPYLFVVPEASSQKAITAEEAYFTFGFGAAGNVEPWTDESLLFIRPTTKSTLLAMAASIGVPAAKWKGVSKDTSSAVVTSVATSPTPEKTLGILGAELYDAQRATLNALAFQAYKQKHAYFPDSTATSFDKRNVRDGHYTIWSPTVYLAPVDGNGTIVNPRTRYVVDLILSRTVSPAPDFDPLATVIAKGLVPDCAMKVTRSFEAGDLSNYAPAEPCGCYYESKVGMASASCKACTMDNPCGSGTCRYGYCEAT